MGSKQHSLGTIQGLLYTGIRFLQKLGGVIQRSPTLVRDPLGQKDLWGDTSWSERISRGPCLACRHCLGPKDFASRTPQTVSKSKGMNVESENPLTRKMRGFVAGKHEP